MSFPQLSHSQTPNKKCTSWAGLLGSSDRTPKLQVETTTLKTTCKNNCMCQVTQMHWKHQRFQTLFNSFASVFWKPAQLFFPAQHNLATTPDQQNHPKATTTSRLTSKWAPQDNQTSPHPAAPQPLPCAHRTAGPRPPWCNGGSGWLRKAERWAAGLWSRLTWTPLSAPAQTFYGPEYPELCTDGK